MLFWATKLVVMCYSMYRRLMLPTFRLSLTNLLRGPDGVVLA